MHDMPAQPPESAIYAFVGHRNWEKGGWHNFVGKYATEDEALQRINEVASKFIVDWYHLVKDEKIIKERFRSYRSGEWKKQVDEEWEP